MILDQYKHSHKRHHNGNQKVVDEEASFEDQFEWHDEGSDERGNAEEGGEDDHGDEDGVGDLFDGVVAHDEEEDDVEEPLV